MNKEYWVIDYEKGKRVGKFIGQYHQDSCGVMDGSTEIELDLEDINDLEHLLTWLKGEVTKNQ